VRWRDVSESEGRPWGSACCASASCPTKQTLRHYSPPQQCRHSAARQTTSQPPEKDVIHCIGHTNSTTVPVTMKQSGWRIVPVLLRKPNRRSWETRSLIADMPLQLLFAYSLPMRSLVSRPTMSSNSPYTTARDILIPAGRMP
jgi:hypothetical protein